MRPRELPTNDPTFQNLRDLIWLRSILIAGLLLVTVVAYYR